MELIDSCEKALKDGRCLGCVALENTYFRGNKDCQYSKVPTAEESIKQIKLILGMEETKDEHTKNNK